jgi:hypothetical protein
MDAIDSPSLNIKALRALYSSDPIAKSVLDEFASRQRNQQKTKLDQLLLRLSNAGKAAPRTGVINVLRKLNEYGCGNFITGRKGHPTRFEWQYDLVSVGKAAAGGSQSVEEIQPVDDDENGDEETVDTPEGAIEHKYQLRPDWSVSLVLPADLTAREAGRLSEFIKTLPFDAPEA